MSNQFVCLDVALVIPQKGVGRSRLCHLMEAQVAAVSQASADMVFVDTAVTEALLLELVGLAAAALAHFLTFRTMV